MEMPFRTLEISHAAEIHINNGQLHLNDPPKMVYRSTEIEKFGGIWNEKKLECTGQVKL